MGMTCLSPEEGDRKKLLTFREARNQRMTPPTAGARMRHEGRNFLLPRALRAQRVDRPDVDRHRLQATERGLERVPSVAVLVEESLGPRVVPPRLEHQEIVQEVADGAGELLGVGAEVGRGVD